MNAKNLTTRSFKLLLKRADLPHSVCVHDLRHTCATVLLKVGQHSRGSMYATPKPSASSCTGS